MRLCWNGPPRENRRKRHAGRAGLFRLLRTGVVAMALMPAGACNRGQPETPASLVQSYAVLPLNVDRSVLAPSEIEALRQLKLAAAPIDRIFWQQVYPEIGATRLRLEQSQDSTDRAKLAFLMINYGPWDRLRNHRNFLGGEERPPGAAFYPADLHSMDFEGYLVRKPAARPLLESPTTLVKRQSGAFEAVPYQEAYREDLQESASHLQEAARLLKRPALSTFLRERAAALLSSSYGRSDELWVKLRDQPLDVVIGPIEVSEDQLIGIKAAYEAAVLVRDAGGSQDLGQALGWAGMLLPDLGFQGAKTPHTIEVWQAALFAGQLNAGVKTVALTLPNDETVRDEVGTRKLIFSNVLRAKFQRVLRPMAAALLEPARAQDVTESALFLQVLLHEACHGFEAGSDLAPLADAAAPLDELKADVLAMALAERAAQKGWIDANMWRQLRTAYLVGVLRAVRMGAGSAHARANAIQLDALHAAKALRLEKGVVKVDLDKIMPAVAPLVETVRGIEQRADYAAASRLLDERARVPINLQRKLIALTQVPVDVHFQYGD